MLSRTAESLFWTARQMERADSFARKLEVAYRMSLMPGESDPHAYTSEWQSILAASNSIENFNASYSEITQANIENFIIYDTNNPSSIRNCIRAARNNAREARTALTSDVWHAINRSYLEFKKIERARNYDLPNLCDWVKRQDALLRGAFINTQLHLDGSDFFNLGYYIERADNTARVLDIKYHILLPTIEMIGGGVDNYQWSTLLRALSAYRSFHWAYSENHSTEKIADFLILNPACPRSLYYCVQQTNYHLDRLCNAYQSDNNAQAHAKKMHQELDNTNVDTIMQEGLHEFLVGFIDENSRLANEISESFLFGEYR